MRVRVRNADVFDHQHADKVAELLSEWRRWRTGQASTVQARSLVWDEIKAASIDANKGQAKPIGFVAHSAERTDRTLAELERQSVEQAKALVVYHLQTSAYVAIAAKLKCDRKRVSEVLRLAHDNFVAIRPYV